MFPSPESRSSISPFEAGLKRYRCCLSRLAGAGKSAQSHEDIAWGRHSRASQTFTPRLNLLQGETWMTCDDILALIAQETGLPIERLQPDETLGTLDISSIDLVSMLFELEDRYGIELQPEELTREMTLRQLFDRIGVPLPQ
jgi:acyl carrier protein